MHIVKTSQPWATRVRRTPVLACVVIGWLIAATSATAQQRPLVTEDPETIGAGRVLVEAGVTVLRGERYPVSGLEGNFFGAPHLGLSVGISSIAEIQIDGVSFNRLSVTERVDAPLSGLVTADGSSTSSFDDLVIGTKVRLVAEGASRPSFGLRFATKLPNASNESGLGLDTTDFFASLLLAKTVESVRVVGNVGVGILGDPTRGDRQNDVLTYGLSFARAVSNATEVVGGLNGHINMREGETPPGTDSRSTFRVGGRYTIGSWRADAAVLVGVTSRNAEIGMTAGATYVFNAFDLP